MVKQQSVVGGAVSGDIPVSGRLRKRKRRAYLPHDRARVKGKYEPFYEKSDTSQSQNGNIVFLRAHSPVQVFYVSQGTQNVKKKGSKSRLYANKKPLRMLSQKQAEADPGAEPSSCGKVGSNGAEAGLQQPSGSGAVTPGGFINGEGSEEFLSTGRTGRRNAMPDILGQHAETGTADLPERFEALTTDSAGARSPAEPGPSQQ